MNLFITFCGALTLGLLSIYIFHFRHGITSASIHSCGPKDGEVSSDVFVLVLIGQLRLAFAVCTVAALASIGLGMYIAIMMVSNSHVINVVNLSADLMCFINLLLTNQAYKMYRLILIKIQNSLSKD